MNKGIKVCTNGCSRLSQQQQQHYKSKHLKTVGGFGQKDKLQQDIVNFRFLACEEFVFEHTVLLGS